LRETELTRRASKWVSGVKSQTLAPRQVSLQQ
jgi:hypothetical protein